MFNNAIYWLSNLAADLYTFFSHLSELRTGICSMRGFNPPPPKRRNPKFLNYFIKEMYDWWYHFCEHRRHHRRAKRINYHHERWKGRTSTLEEYKSLGGNNRVGISEHLPLGLLIRFHIMVYKRYIKRLFWFLMWQMPIAYTFCWSFVLERILCDWYYLIFHLSFAINYYFVWQYYIFVGYFFTDWPGPYVRAKSMFWLAIYPFLCIVFRMRVLATTFWGIYILFYPGWSVTCFNYTLNHICVTGDVKAQLLLYNYFITVVPYVWILFKYIFFCIIILELLIPLIIFFSVRYRRYTFILSKKFENLVKLFERIFVNLYVIFIYAVVLAYLFLIMYVKYCYCN